jgi:acetyltransferase-like isoleucine patch superfamily enzyme
MFPLPNKLLLIKYKLNKLRMQFRVAYLKKLGMQIGSNSIVGNICTTSPNSVIIGRHCEIRNGVSFWVRNPFDSQNGIYIGNNTFLGEKIEFNCCGQIHIGNNCLIASSVIFVDSSHIFSRADIINKQSVNIGNIIVEDDVWIGSGAIILKGIKIEQGAVIGANSLINKDILSCEIWAGCPAKKIGERK